MARAKVVLRKCQTFQAAPNKGGRKWKKGAPVILTNENEIDYYRGQAEFVVTDLGEPKKKAAKETPADDGGGDDGGDDKHTKASLMRMSKDDLMTLAEDTFGLELEGDETKDDLAEAILEAQG
jgi:hypothetical protein